jgi:hypothetical protein
VSQLLRVGDYVEARDAATGDREGRHCQHAILYGHDHARRTIDDRRPAIASARRSLGEHYARHVGGSVELGPDARRALIDSHNHVWIEHLEQGIKIAVA